LNTDVNFLNYTHFLVLLDSVQQRIDGAAITLTALSIGDLAQTLSSVDGTPAAALVATAAAEGTTFLFLSVMLVRLVSSQNKYLQNIRRILSALLTSALSIQTAQTLP